MRLIESEIHELNKKLLDMATLVLQQLDTVTKNLHDPNPYVISRLKKNEKRVDKFDSKIDKRCERLIALYQPVANDLRFVFSVLKINAFLEQIGDYANAIGRKRMLIKEPIDEKLLQDLQIQTMYLATRQMLSNALHAFFERDANLARQVFPQDEAVDDINSKDLKAIVTIIQSNPARTSDYLQLLFIVKNLELIADYAVHIAEETIFFLEGVTYRHSELKYAYKNEISTE